MSMYKCTTEGFTALAAYINSTQLKHNLCAASTQYTHSLIYMYMYTHTSIQ